MMFYLLRRFSLISHADSTAVPERTPIRYQNSIGLSPVFASLDGVPIAIGEVRIAPKTIPHFVCVGCKISGAAETVVVSCSNGVLIAPKTIPLFVCVGCKISAAAETVVVSCSNGVLIAPETSPLSDCIGIDVFKIVKIVVTVESGVVIVSLAGVKVDAAGAEVVVLIDGIVSHVIVVSSM